MKTTRYAYLHGFASSPAAYKGNKLRERLAGHGVELALPNLNQPSFSELTLTGSLQVIETLCGHGETRWRLIGSSMGGYLAALWAQRNPDRIDRLVLLCPGFNLAERWAEWLGPAGVERWGTAGSLAFPDATGQLTPVHFALYHDSLKHPPYPAAPCPTLIIHGNQDEQVPIASSRRYAYEHAHVKLIELTDDHGLANSIQPIGSLIEEFFELRD